jgi:toxin ParE1/3/4
MSRYVLAPAAQEDLIAIRDYYLKEAGYRIARHMLVEFTKSFQTIAHTPGIGHKREDLAGDRPVLFWPMRDLPDHLPVRHQSRGNRHDCSG